MPNYRRFHRPGGTYFFNVATFDRHPFLCEFPARLALREAIRKTRLKWPFQMDAIVLLPDHFHCMITLPENETDYSTRMKCIKSAFTKNPIAWQYRLKSRRFSESRSNKKEQPVWQRRFYEHTIRDDKDYENHFHYIHYNPVKHGYSASPARWPFSSFWRYAKKGYYSHKWGMDREPVLPDMAVGE
jgi:putative transposase